MPSIGNLFRSVPRWASAIIAFWLTLFVGLNLFRAFISLNTKPVPRAKHTDLYFAKAIFAGLHEETFPNRSP